MNIKDDFILSDINEGYLVGGAVRDFLMGNTIIYDRDIAIKNAKRFADKLSEKYSGTMITLDEENKIYRIVLPDRINYLDISELQGENIEEDIKRRDFTINAIAYSLKDEVYIDPADGISDLQNGVLNHINDSNFEEDPLRILRAFRFLSTTGFKPTEKLISVITKYRELLLIPSKERIMYEIMKLFGGKFCSESLLLMDKLGILECLFPFVQDMKKVPPNTHHHLDLFRHVIETVKNIEELYENAPIQEREHLNRVDFGGFARINHLKLAGFMHDIGKFSTWTIEEDTKRHRFIKHDDIGSKLCIPFLKDLKFSKKQIEYISNMIKNHIYPSSVISAPDLTEKVMMRYLRKMEDNVIDNIILAKADRLSARGEDITEEVVNNNINGLNKLLSFYFEKKDLMQPLPKLLSGEDVMRIKGLKPSPTLGKIMNALHESQLNGDVVTKDDAEKFIKEYQV